MQVIKENTREIRRRGTATEKETAAILNSAQAIQTHTEAIGATTSATKTLALVRAHSTLWSYLLTEPHCRKKLPKPEREVRHS